MSKHNFHFNRLAPSPVHFAKPQAAKAAASSCLTWMNLILPCRVRSASIMLLIAGKAEDLDAATGMLAIFKRPFRDIELRDQIFPSDQGHNYDEMMAKYVTGPPGMTHTGAVVDPSWSAAMGCIGH